MEVHVLSSCSNVLTFLWKVDSRFREGDEGVLGGLRC